MNYYALQPGTKVLVHDAEGGTQGIIVATIIGQYGAIQYEVECLIESVVPNRNIYHERFVTPMEQGYNLIGFDMDIDKKYRPMNVITNVQKKG